MLNQIYITLTTIPLPFSLFFLLLTSENSSDLRVKHKHHGSSNSTESIGTSTLEESRSSLILHNLSEAISSALVHPLRLWLLGLHLKTTTHGIEWVGCVSSQDGRSLRTSEFGTGTDEVVGVLLVGVKTREGVEETEIDSTVRNDSNNRHSNTIVQTTNTTGGHSLLQAVKKSIELTLSGSNIRCKTRTGVIEGVDDTEGSGSSKSTRSHVDSEEFGELSVLVCLREHSLNTILEGEVECLGREVPDDVCQVTTPESTNTLLLSNTGKAVSNSSVTGDLSTDNFGVGILGLDEELDTLDGSGTGFGHGTGDATSKEVNHKVRHGGVVVGV
mmetsp:Transcript_6293/g.13690  ORF Transcript_6293/g.13690 Transcript_6293/m.13690 type:complete len:330 (-) Transcript_6293:364-1353(-)